MRTVIINGMVLTTCAKCPHFCGESRYHRAFCNYNDKALPYEPGYDFAVIPVICPLPRELEHEASEEILTLADRDILDKGMKEIAALGAWPEDYEHLPELRAAVITMSLRFNYSLRDTVHVLYCIVSAGIPKDKILATLRFCFELSAKLRVSPAVAENMVTCFVNSGLMNGEKIGEPGVYSLRGIDFQPPRMLKPEGKEAEAAPGKGILKKVLEDFAENKAAEILEAAIRSLVENTRGRAASGPSAVDGLTSWAAAWLSPEEIDACRPEWQKAELRIAALAERMLLAAACRLSTYQAEGSQRVKLCFYIAAEYESERKERMAEAHDRAKHEEEKE